MLSGKSSKISIAKSLMIQTMDSLRFLENIELALRIYGHQSKILPGKQDCFDTKLEVPFASANDNYQNIINEIRRLQPKGTTPIARSLEYSAEDFPSCDDCRNIIILITDGMEACDEDPCAVAIALKEKILAQTICYWTRVRYFLLKSISMYRRVFEC